MQGETTIFYENEYQRATNRLGWISAPARKFLIGRHALRSIGCLENEWRSRISEFDKKFLRLLRSLFETQLIGAIDASRISAPYKPTGRPETYFLSISRGESLFCVDTKAILRPETVFFWGGGEVHDYDSERVPGLEMADRVLARDILHATQGTNLSTKWKAEERCVAMAQQTLWHGISSQHLAESASDIFSKLVQAQGSTWRFWRDWYQSLVDGKPLDWELQRRISLIDEAIWDQGPAAVSEEIELIKTAYLAERLPQAETIEVNPDTSKLRAVPIPVENAPLMSALITQIADATEDALQGHNGLTDRSGDIRRLNRVITRYGNDPQQAELTLTTVAKSLRRQIHDSGELPDNEDNLALLDAVEDGVRGIRANHPEVAANREQLAQQAMQELSAEDKQVLEEAQPLLIAISEGAMAEDFAEDIPELTNDAARPLPTGAPALPGADATTRIFSRVSKMALLVDNAKKLAKTGAQTFDSDLVKTIRLAGLTVTTLGGVGAILYNLVQIGLRILGVL